MDAIIYNTELEVVAVHRLLTFIEACEWVEQYLGWHGLARIKTKVDHTRKTIKVLAKKEFA